VLKDRTISRSPDSGIATNAPSTAVADEASTGRQVQVVPFDRLSLSELIAWNNLRSTRMEFSTPFFSARYAEAVHRARGDVSVAVVREGSEVIGILPFHRFRSSAVPVGRFLNDSHNLIADRSTMIDWIWLLEKLDCKAFDFHAMVGCDDESLHQYAYGTSQSFQANIGDDPAAFLASLGRAHKTIGRQGQKTRKLAREVGQVHAELDCPDPDLLRQAIDWKRDQYRRSHLLDLFTPDWTRELLHQLHSGASFVDPQQSPRGILSILRAGDRVIAAHYGMLENGLLHYWFPVYDPAYAKYSPGTALFVEIIRNAQQFGITCIDMGYGELPYKRRQTDATGEVAFGCISRSRFHHRWRRLETATIRTMKKMPMKESAKKIWRRLKPQAGISKLR
jgi:CelD/BcsL family acetyltransferase involved in cellulose biosynthesis